MSMLRRGWWIPLLIGALGLHRVNTASGAEKCISKDDGELAVIKLEFCLVTKRDLKLSCPESSVVSLTSVQVAVKNHSEQCVKRVLAPKHEFCCYPQRGDVLYDSQCLQHVWNSEDATHFQQFISDALDLCTHKSQCVLTAHSFERIQRETPSTNQFSSYFQVVYQCIKTPTDPVQMCSSRRMEGSEVHLQGGSQPKTYTTNTCTCQVTSETTGDVIVRAMDVRTTTAELILNSKDKIKNISHSKTPLFGGEEIFSGTSVNISFKTGAVGGDEGIWLQISGAESQDVQVICGEGVQETVRSSTSAGAVSTVPPHLTHDTQHTQQSWDKVVWGYWPLIYAGAGSIITILLVCCVLCAILVCRFRKKRRRRRHPCGYPSMSPSGEFHYDAPYAAVQDEAHHTPHSRACTQGRVYEKPGMMTCPGATSMNVIRPPSAPPPPPPPLELSSDVSELEAFLECKDNVTRGHRRH